MTSLGSTIVLLLLAASFPEEPSVSIGCLIVLTAVGIYVTGIQLEYVESASMTRVGRYLK